MHEQVKIRRAVERSGGCGLLHKYVFNILENSRSAEYKMAVQYIYTFVHLEIICSYIQHGHSLHCFSIVSVFVKKKIIVIYSLIVLEGLFYNTFCILTDSVNTYKQYDFMPCYFFFFLQCKNMYIVFKIWWPLRIAPQ